MTAANKFDHIKAFVQSTPAGFEAITTWGHLIGAYPTRAEAEAAIVSYLREQAR